MQLIHSVRNPNPIMITLSLLRQGEDPISLEQRTTPFRLRPLVVPPRASGIIDALEETPCEASKSHIGQHLFGLRELDSPSPTPNELRCSTNSLAQYRANQSFQQAFSDINLKQK